MITIMEYIELWDKVYVWGEGEREKFIEGMHHYAESKGVAFEDLCLEKED